MIRKSIVLLLIVFTSLLTNLHAQRTEAVPRLGIEGSSVHLQVWTIAKDSAADQSGIQLGDQLMIFDSQPLATGVQLLGVIGTAAPGPHEVTVLRDGKITQLNVVLGPAGSNRLGVAFVSGVRVEKIDSDSPANTLRLQRGDLITSFRLNDKVLATPSLQDLIKYANALPSSQPVGIIYMRDHASVTAFLTLTTAPTADASVLEPAASQTVLSRRGLAPQGDSGASSPVRPVPPGASRFEGGGQQGDSVVSGQGSQAATPSSGRGAVTRDPAAMAQAVQDARSERLTQRMRGASSGGAAVATQRNATLDQMLVKTSYTPAATLGKRMKEMNVLKYAFIDKKTGEVVLVGAYDSNYATGPIAYNALLADAMQNPYPRFTLEYPGSGANSPLARIRTTLDQEFAHISRDPNYGVEWLGKLVLPVLKGESQDPDQQAALNAKLKAVGITPESYRAYMKWQLSKFEDMQAYNEGAKDFLPSIFASLGKNPRTGAEITAYRVYATQANRETLDRWCETAGLADLENQIDQKIRQTGNHHLATTELLPALYGSILRGLGVPERQLSQILSAFRSSGDEGLLVRPLEERYQEIFKQVLMDRVVNGMSFTGTTLARQYGFPAIQSPLNTYGARRDSPVMNVFFNADYILKFMTSSARPTESIPAHQSSQNYLAAAENRAGGSAGRTPVSGVIRYWLYPQAVQMDALSDNSGVRFGNASVKVGVESMEMEGADRTGADFYKTTLQQYGNQLTANYEQYARFYPALHTLRETEKIVALARWAQKNGLHVNVQPESAPNAPLPASAEGFWGMTYIVRPSGSTDTMVTWAQGGVDFGQQNGDGWMQTGLPDRQVTDDALRSLAASTALSERAAAAAMSGDLESARFLAERGAQAMSGNIDLTNVPAVPMPTSLEVDPASAAAVSQASIEAVDRETQAQREANQDQAKAASLSASDPAQAAQLAQQSQELKSRSDADLTRLQGMLQQYRNSPGSGAQVAVDLHNLDPYKPATGVSNTTLQPGVALPQISGVVQPIPQTSTTTTRPGSLASNVPPLPGSKPTEYRYEGNGLIGGTGWIYGFNVPPGSSDEMRARAEGGLRIQLKLAGETEDKFISTKNYNYILGTAVTQSLTVGNALLTKDELARIVADDTQQGQQTAQNQALYASLRGRQFDRLDCHSNGAMICLAALSDEDAKAAHIRLFGPEITQESLLKWQHLIDTGKVKDVQIYINRGDPVPVTSYLRTNLTDYKIVGDNDALKTQMESLAPGIHVQINDCTLSGLQCHYMKQYQDIVDSPQR